MKINKLILAPALVVVSLAAIIHFSPTVHADTITSNVTVAVGTSCIGYVNGNTGTTYVDVTPGSNVDLIVTNNDNVVTQSISGSGVAGGTEVQPNTKTTNNVTSVSLSSVTAPVTVTITPQIYSGNSTPFTNNCPTGSNPVASSLVVNPAAATLSCALSDNSWLLTGTFSGSSTGTQLVSGSSQIGPSISAPQAISQKIAASTATETFSVLDGLNYGGKGTILVSTNCPKYVAPATVAPTTTTAAPTTPSTAPISTPAKSTTGSSSGSGPTAPASQLISSRPNQTIHASNTGLYIKTGVGIGIIVLGVIGLIISGLWTAPKQLFSKLWSKNPLAHR